MRPILTVILAVICALTGAACVAPTRSYSPAAAPTPELTSAETTTQSVVITPPSVKETLPALTPVPDAANVISVEVRGEPGSYQFSVGIESPDTGCQQYADWWEVVTPSGELLYRRILLHSHASEQPFVRSGGPVDIQANTQVRVRAHMNTSGYGGLMFEGSVQAGFSQIPGDAHFAPELARQHPLPGGCAF